MAGPARWARSRLSQPAQIPGTRNFVPKIPSRNLSRLGELLNTQKNVHFSGSRGPPVRGALGAPPGGGLVGGPRGARFRGVRRGVPEGPFWRLFVVYMGQEGGKRGVGPPAGRGHPARRVLAGPRVRARGGTLGARIGRSPTGRPGAGPGAPGRAGPARRARLAPAPGTGSWGLLAGPGPGGASWGRSGGPRGGLRGGC